MATATGVLSGVGVSSVVAVAEGRMVFVGAGVCVAVGSVDAGTSTAVCVAAGEAARTVVPVLKNGIGMALTGDRTVTNSGGIRSGRKRVAPATENASRSKTTTIEEKRRRPLRFLPLRFGLKTGASFGNASFFPLAFRLASGCDSFSMALCFCSSSASGGGGGIT